MSLLITEAIIKEGLDHKVIKQWAYILHFRDIYTEENEIADRLGLVKAKEIKFAHWHIILSTPSQVPVLTIAQWFQVLPNQVEIMSGCDAFLDGIEYLMHKSHKAVDQHKTHYDNDELNASKGFNFREEINDLQRDRVLYGKRSDDITLADTMRMYVIQDDPLTYAKIWNSLLSLRLDY